MTRGRAGRSRRIGGVAIAGVVVVLLIALATVLPSGFALSQRRTNGALVVPDLPPAAGPIGVAIAAVVLAAGIALQILSFRSRARAERAKRAPLWLQLLVFLLVLLLVLLVAGLAQRQEDRRQPRPRPSRGSSVTPSSPARDRDDAAPRASRPLGVVVTLLLLAVLVAMVAALAWLFWPERPPDLAAGDPDVVVGELGAGLDDLERIGDPRAAVIACYARMERILAACGIPRRSSDTPLELLGRVLRRHRAAEPSVARLTHLFERARFSTHEVDETMRRRAVDAVSEVRDQIVAPS
jgi:NADH:ubiquinone oxidoreductase subunit 6 (subunit J)